MAVAGDKVRGVVLRGVRPEDFKARAPLSAAIEGPAELRDRYRGLCRGRGRQADRLGVAERLRQRFLGRDRHAAWPTC